MKIYRLRPDCDLKHLYLRGTGNSFIETLDVLKGNRVDEFLFKEIDLGNKSKKKPDFLGSSFSEYFVNQKFKKELEAVSGINLVKTQILNKDYWFVNK